MRESVVSGKTPADYCEALVRRRDNHRWLAAHFISKPAREAMFALYALHIEIAEVPAAVSEPQLGEIRLQWWRDALDEVMVAKQGGNVRAHPVVQQLASLEIIDQAARDIFEEAIDARADVLYQPVFSTIDAFVAWGRRAEGYLAQVGPGAKSDPEARELELVYSLSALTRSMLPSPLHSGARDQLAELKKAKSKSMNNLPPDQTARFAHLSLIGMRLRESQGVFSPLLARLILFRTIASGRF